MVSICHVGHVRNLKLAASLSVVALAVAGCAVNPNQTGDTVTCHYRVSGQPATIVDPPSGTDVPAKGTATVTLTFADGPVKITLNREAAPCTVNSFVSLAEQGYFTGTTCHRLSTSGIFILQCGDPTGRGTGGPGYTFNDELKGNETYPAGVIAMANSGPNTNGSQFFLVFADTPLPPDYTVFGTMDEASTQVIADLAFQGHDNSHGDGTGRPLGNSTITSVSLG